MIPVLIAIHSFLPAGAPVIQTSAPSTFKVDAIYKIPPVQEPWGDTPVASPAYVYPPQEAMAQLTSGLLTNALASSSAIAVFENGPSDTGMLNGRKVNVSATVSNMKVRPGIQGLTWLRTLDMLDTRWNITTEIKLKVEEDGKAPIEVTGIGSATGLVKTATYESGDTKLKSASFRQTPVGQSARLAVEDAVKKLNKLVGVEAKIAKGIKTKEGSEELYISAGFRLGAKVGQEFGIFDPANVTSGPVGRCTITSVQPKLSVATLNSGRYEVGYLVKPLGQDKAK